MPSYFWKESKEPEVFTLEHQELYRRSTPGSVVRVDVENIGVYTGSNINTKGGKEDVRNYLRLR